MNFLAHLHLVRGDGKLMLGALLGDYVRGTHAVRAWSPGISEGIRLHRKIDQFTDSSEQVRALQKRFPKPFRRYSGIIIDLGFDHALASNWSRYSETTLEEFDREIRGVVNDCRDELPEQLTSFMHYADRRGLFSAYRDENEILISLAGIGTRLKRNNPLHRVSEIWPELKAPIVDSFESFYPQLQSWVQSLLNRRSTTTGS